MQSIFSLASEDKCPEELESALCILPSLCSHPHTLSLSLPPLLDALVRLTLPGGKLAVGDGHGAMATATSRCLRMLMEHSDRALEPGSMVQLLVLCVRGVEVGGGGGEVGEVVRQVIEDVAVVLSYHCRRVEEEEG